MSNFASLSLKWDLKGTATPAVFNPELVFSCYFNLSIRAGKSIVVILYAMFFGFWLPEEMPQMLLAELINWKSNPMLDFNKSPNF